MLLSGAVFAQKKDSVQARQFIPTGLRVGLDVVPFGRAELSDSYAGFEAAVDIDLYAYYPTFELGNSERTFNAENGSTYSNTGNFWRAGVDVNFLKRNVEKNMFSLGFRYGRSTYSEKATIITTDEVWGNYASTFENTGMTAGWMEIVTGMRIKVWKIFWLGYTGRFKFVLAQNRDRSLLSTDVPGYGGTDRPTTWGFSYYVMAKLPVRKTR